MKEVDESSRRVTVAKPRSGGPNVRKEPAVGQTRMMRTLPYVLNLFKHLDSNLLNRHGYPEMTHSPTHLLQTVSRIVPGACVAVITLALLHGCAITPARVNSAEQNFRAAAETKPFFEQAHGYAIFPSVGKAAVGLGGAFGNGVIYREGTLVGEARVSELSIGFALGGQSHSELIFFSDARALGEFCSGQFEFGANASAVAITAGASATAASSGVHASASSSPESARLAADYRKGMAVFTLTQGGLMYEAAIAGQKFAADCRL